MTQTPQTQPRRYSLDEYFRLKRDSTVKHDFRNGQLIDMAGGTPEHSLITTNLISELSPRLKGSGCKVFDSNLRIRIAKKYRYTYPDVSVVCGDVRLDADDPTRTTVTNPRVVVEVLSPTTEKYDRGDKFLYYLELESIEEYVIVAQNAPRVETLFRQGDGTWLLAFAMGRDAVARLRSLRIDLPLNEVYAGVEFPPQDDAP